MKLFFLLLSEISGFIEVNVIFTLVARVNILYIQVKKIQIKMARYLQLLKDPQHLMDQ